MPLAAAFSTTSFAGMSRRSSRTKAALFTFWVRVLVFVFAVFLLVFFALGMPVTL
jgi:hypothetical protein